MTTLYKSLALAGSLAAGLSLGSLFSDQTKNIEGDGIKPANSLTSRLLGVDRWYHCEPNLAYHPGQSSLDEDEPWDCDFMASVSTEQHMRVDAQKSIGYVTVEPERLKHKVAKVMGTGMELLFAAAAMGAGVYKGRRK